MVNEIENEQKVELKYSNNCYGDYIFDNTIENDNELNEINRLKSLWLLWIQLKSMYQRVKILLIELEERFIKF